MLHSATRQAGAINMGRRAYKRIRIALPVTISGMDINGNPFKQTATTVEIGARGMRLRDVYCVRGRGDRVKVEYKKALADFRVAWIDETQGLVGLEGLERAQFLFAKHLPPDVKTMPDSRADTFVLPGEGGPIGMAPVVKPIPMAAGPAERRLQERRQEERRKHPRYHCAGEVRLLESGLPQSTTWRMNEISMSGCYIETMWPHPAGTSIELELAVNGRTIRLESIVRSSQVACGMGLEFMKIEPSEAEKLNRVIAELSGESPIEPVEAAPAPAVSREPVPSKELSEAIQRWFGAHDSLSRADFLKIAEDLSHARNATHHVET